MLSHLSFIKLLCLFKTKTKIKTLTSNTKPKSIKTHHLLEMDDRQSIPFPFSRETEKQVMHSVSVQLLPKWPFLKLLIRPGEHVRLYIHTCICTSL